MGYVGVIIFLLVHLLSVGVKGASETAAGDCYWSGTSPICNGNCRPGETVAAESHKGDGKGCMVGKMKYCCKNGTLSESTKLQENSIVITTPTLTTPSSSSLKDASTTVEITTTTRKRKPIIPVRQVLPNLSNFEELPFLKSTNPTTKISIATTPSPSSIKGGCYWVGTPPFCKGNCNGDDVVVNTSRTNNETTCITGKMKYCCTSTADMPILIKDTVTKVTTTLPSAVLETITPPNEVVSDLLKSKELRNLEMTNPATESAVKTTPSPPLAKGDCYWIGTPPICKGNCHGNDVVVNTSRTSSDSTCIVGKLKYCCSLSANGPTTSSIENAMTTVEIPTTTHKIKPAHRTTTPVHEVVTGILKTEELPAFETTNSTTEFSVATTTLSSLSKGGCYWVGTPPFCKGDCHGNDVIVNTSRTNNDSTCITGKMKHCCAESSDIPTLLHNNVTMITTILPSEAHETVTPAHEVVSGLSKSEKPSDLEITNPTTALPISTTSTPPSTKKGECYWVGTPPVCKGNCNGDDVVVKTSRTSNDSTCAIGKMKYCCTGSTDMPLSKDKVVTMVTTTLRSETSKPTSVPTEIFISSNTDSPVHKKTNPIKILTNSTSSATALKRHCYWAGTPPNCEETCNEGDRLVYTTDGKTNGTSCVTGERKRCCKGSVAPTLHLHHKNGTMERSTTQSSTPVEAVLTITEKAMTTNHSKCYWSGNPPACEGSCRLGEYVAAVSIHGDGGMCESGKRKYCCPRHKTTTTAPDQTQSVTVSAIISTTTEGLNIVSGMNSSTQPDRQRVMGRLTLNPNATSVRRQPKVFSVDRKLAISTLPTVSNWNMLKTTTPSMLTPVDSTPATILVTSETSTTTQKLPTLQTTSVPSATSPTTFEPSTTAQTTTVLSTTPPTTSISSTIPQTTSIPTTTSQTTSAPSTTPQTTSVPFTTSQTPSITSTTLQPTSVPSVTAQATTIPTTTPETISILSTTPQTTFVPSTTSPTTSKPFTTAQTTTVSSTTPPTTSIPSTIPQTMSISTTTSQTTTVTLTTPQTTSVPFTTSQATTIPTTTPETISILSTTPQTTSVPSTVLQTTSIPTTTSQTATVPPTTPQTTSTLSTTPEATTVQSTTSQTTFVPSTIPQSTSLPSKASETTTPPSTILQTTSIPTTTSQATTVPTTTPETTFLPFTTSQTTPIPFTTIQTTSVPTTSQTTSIPSTTSQMTIIPSTIPQTTIPNTTLQTTTVPPTIPQNTSVPFITSEITSIPSATLQPISVTTTTAQTTTMPPTISQTTSTLLLRSKTVSPTTNARQKFSRIILPNILPVPLIFRDHPELLLNPWGEIQSSTPASTKPFTVAAPRKN